MDNATVLAFKAISGFIADLTAEFGSKMKSIVLYNRLLEKTGLVHTKPILKHVECFRTFFRENVAAMEQRKPSAFANPKISYSDRVYLDMSVIFREAPRDSVEIIWRHLYAIWGLVDPSSQARRLLAETMKQGGDNGKESDFLSSIIDKVEKTVKSGDVDTSNPMGAVSKLMSSGVFTDLIQGMQTGLSDGSLNIGKLMGSVQGLMGKMGGGGSSSGGGGMPDLGAMMSMIGPMMSGMSGGVSGMPSEAASASSSSSSSSASQAASSKDAPGDSDEKKE